MPGRPGGRFGKSFYRRLEADEKQAYKDYLDGTRKHTVPRAISGADRAKVALAVCPFGIVPAAAAVADSENYQVTATTQAIGIAKSIETALVTTFGILETPVAGNTTDEGFYPALVKPTVKPAGSTATTNESAFTGRTNDKYQSRSGSIPFGRSQSASLTTDYDARKNAILTLWQSADITGADKMGITFSPEYWDNPPAAIGGNAAGVSAGINF